MNTNYQITRDDVKELAGEIENLATELKSKLAFSPKGNEGPLEVGTELYGKMGTLVFSLGELFHSEKSLPATTGTVVATPLKQLSQVRLNYHNKRDSKGRFLKK